MELVGVGETQSGSCTQELMAAIVPLECVQELTPKNPAEHLDRQKEWISRIDPRAVIEREATGGYNTVDVGMEEQVLPPGVKDALHPDVGAQVFGIGRHFQCSGSAGREQQVVEEARVGQRE